MSAGEDNEALLSHEPSSSRPIHDSDDDDDDGAATKLLPNGSDHAQDEWPQLAHHSPHEKESNWKIVRDIVLEVSLVTPTTFRPEYVAPDDANATFDDRRPTFHRGVARTHFCEHFSRLSLQDL